MIVKKFVKGNINWAREIKIAQKLIKRFNSFNFWDNLKQLGSPPPSLAWFLKPEGKAFLLREYETFNLKLNKNLISLERDKVGVDKKIFKKSKTLIDFLKNKNEA
jgi:hypothetical protein